MTAEKEFFACLALRHTPFTGIRTVTRILRHYGSAFEAVQDANSWPDLDLAQRRQANACLNEKWREKAEKEYRTVRDCGMQYVCWGDPEYPEHLQNIPDAPPVLYYVGDVVLLSAPSVAVVGARECTDLGMDSAAFISKGLSEKGVTVVSGMAAGIDGCAHRAALQGVGKTVAVLGTGLDVIFPKENARLYKEIAEQGCVVTEYAPGTPARSANFPQRNRIISGLSLGVVVAEAAQKSGSLITARMAAEQGREVFALPGPMNRPSFSGCHRLLKQGAHLVENAEEIIEHLHTQFALALEEVGQVQAARGSDDTPKGLKQDLRKDVLKKEHVEPVVKTEKPEPKVKTPAPVPDDISDDERELLLILREIGKSHIDELTRKTGWDSARLSSAVLMLEIGGLVQQLPGMWYLAR